MSTRRENQLAVRGVVGKRVEASKPLLERMGITVEAYERVVLNAVIRNPGLADCDRESFDVAVADSIQMGLLPDGQQAAIVPFKNKATVIPMIEGRLMLARRAVPGLALRVRVVYAEDEWDYAEGLRVNLVHRPNPFADKRDDHVIAAYAVAQIPGALEPEFEVFDRPTIDRYRGYSRSGGIWASHFVRWRKRRSGSVAQASPQGGGSAVQPGITGVFHRWPRSDRRYCRE